MQMTLKQARLFAGKTQKEAAKILGITDQTYRKLEETPDITTIGQAKRLSQFFNIPYNYIFFGDNSSLTRETSA